MKSKIKLNHYVLTFFLLVLLISVVDDVVKYNNHKNTLIQNYTNKQINDTQQIREDYRLLLDKLQYDFGRAEAENLTKIDQLYTIYQREGANFSVERAVDELNQGVAFGQYQIFLINREYIIEKASYANDIGYNLGQYKVLRGLFDAMFGGTTEIDVSPIKVDSASMQFKRYLLKRSDDGKYLLQIGFVLNIFNELKEKYNAAKESGKLKLYLANENLIQPIALDQAAHTKRSLEIGWSETKRFLIEMVDDLQIHSQRIDALVGSNISDQRIQINTELDQLFKDDVLLYDLDLSKGQLSIYSVTDGLFNKTTETKLLLKTTYPTKRLEGVLQTLYTQTILHLIVMVLVLGVIYLFILRTITRKLLSIIEYIRSNQHSDVEEIKVNEIAVLNESYNELHHRLNQGIEQNADLLKENKRFIADTVHQIRTPLTNIMMNSEMVKKMQSDDALSSYIDKIDSSINMLSNSYEDLAYVTTADTIEYPPTRVNLSEMMEQRVKFFSTISKVNHKEIEATIQEDLFIYINRIELERIVDNNISNGIKYAEKGKLITINAFSSNGTVIVEFKTYGGPIEDGDRIFEKNYRENEAKRGLGLGLHMVKGICDKYAIQYSVASTSGQNSFAYIFKVE